MDDLDMNDQRIQRLRDAGFSVGSAADFLGLSAEEEALVEMRLALSAYLKQRRVDQKLSQAELARKLQSSQSRVAKMESADPSVSIDLLLKGIVATGATRDEVGCVIAGKLRDVLS